MIEEQIIAGSNISHTENNQIASVIFPNQQQQKNQELIISQQAQDYELLAQSSQNCLLCCNINKNQKESTSLFKLMNSALSQKYQSHSNYLYIKGIEIILDSKEINQEDYKINRQYLNSYREFKYQDDRQQRIIKYLPIEKITKQTQKLLSFYKFHTDVPRNHQQYVEQIMERYYDRQRQAQYKIVKRILKNQENIDLTSIINSSIDNEKLDKDQISVSRFSNILKDLKQQQRKRIIQENIDMESDSLILEKICADIDKKLFRIRDKKQKISLKEIQNDKQFQFKGLFYFNSMKFDQFIKRSNIKQKQRKKTPRKRNIKTAKSVFKLHMEKINKKHHKRNQNVENQEKIIYQLNEFNAIEVRKENQGFLKSKSFNKVPKLQQELLYGIKYRKSVEKKHHINVQVKQNHNSLKMSRQIYNRTNDNQSSQQIAKMYESQPFNFRRQISEKKLQKNNPQAKFPTFKKFIEKDHLKNSVQNQNNPSGIGNIVAKTLEEKNLIKNQNQKLHKFHRTNDFIKKIVNTKFTIYDRL